MNYQKTKKEEKKRAKLEQPEQFPKRLCIQKEYVTHLRRLKVFWLRKYYITNVENFRKTLTKWRLASRTLNQAFYGIRIHLEFTSMYESADK